MASVFWFNICVLFCAHSFAQKAIRKSDEIVFHYNNTYKYNVPYVVDVDRYTEYIMEFAGDLTSDGWDPPAPPARVTVASDFANRTYPLFVTARQQKDRRVLGYLGTAYVQQWTEITLKSVFSWQLPMLVQTPINLEQFTNISRTLCPHNNVFVENEDYCESSNLNTPIVHLTSASPDPIRVTIVVETVQDFYIKLNTTTNLTVTPSQPKYYFYPFVQGPRMDLTAQGLNKKLKCHEPLQASERLQVNKYFVESNALRQSPWTSWFMRPKSVIVIIESDNDVCALVSIQNFSCPVFDNERDILYDGYYLTMTRRGGITLTQDTFPMGFYIVFIVKSSDEDCLSVDHKITNKTAALTDDGRVKNFSFKVIETISYQEYLVACGAALAFFLSFYLGFIIAVLVQKAKYRRSELSEDNSEEGTSTPPLMNESQNDVDNLVNSTRRRNVMSTSGQSGHSEHSVGFVPTTGDGREDSSPSDTDTEYSTVVSNIEKDLYRPGARLCVANLSRCRPRVLVARSKMYLWNVLTVAVFYTLPVIQLVVTYQRLLNQSGNQDLCYFNFLCAHPLLVVSDFNHVFSNLGYVLLGALFLAQVYRRHRAHSNLPKHEKELGIPQHFGLLYAMGIALVSEGLLSAAYHVCPNSMNFQFDTSFMYVTSVLCMVKIYQSRHPDVNARAHATFSVLALIIFIGLVGVLNANLYFWIAFTILHLTACLVITFQIYYLGRFRLDGGVVMRAVSELARRPVAAMTPTHAGRCVLLLIANLANWVLAAYGMSQHSRDFASHLLLVLMSNLFLYTLFYIVMKLLHRETITWYSWIFISLTYTIWFSSSYFYLDQSTNWALTPAQSRQNNRQCSLLQLYDSHDIWHFMSSTAMFFSFNMYLTIDDNLCKVPRSEIMVF